MLKIFSVFCIFNEVELLPFKIDYLNKNEIDYYVFDNMSEDGSWEWLQENKIPSERFDSNGMFDLKRNRDLMHKKIHEVKPDWVMDIPPDTFFVHLKYNNLRDTIEHIDKENYNIVNTGFPLFEFRYTGKEEPGLDPRLSYFYYIDFLPNTKSRCIAKYSNDLSICDWTDYFMLPNKKVYGNADFALLHYAIRHDGWERKTQEYERRKKAWEAEVSLKQWGVHFKEFLSDENWVKSAEKLQDIRKTNFWEHIKRSVVNG